MESPRIDSEPRLGWVMIPPEMWSVALDHHGAWGVVPSAVVDGGGALLAVVLVVSLVVHRHTWARTTAP